MGITTLSGSNTGDETATTIKTALGITTLSGSNTGDQIIPTTLPASDVYTWAKAATKPTYTYTEVGAQVAGTYASGSGSASGTNTGDETATTIKTALGITTLSGSNTGDQTTITGNAGTATSLTGGVLGAIPYQSAAGTTAMTGAGGAGQVLTTLTVGANPTWETPATGSGSGTVTSVGFTGGIITVNTPTVGAALVVAGISGGIPYFSSTSAWESSALLTANNLMIGGGAGTAPSTVTTGTGVLTALGIAIGTAGSFITTTGTAALATSISGQTTNGVLYQSGSGVTTSTLASTAAGQVLVTPTSGGAPTWDYLTLENLPEAWTKKACNAATTVALILNTATASIDGVTLSATNRVLIKNQAAPAENGIYTGVTTTSWVRATDANTISKLAGAVVNVDAGTVNGGKVFDTDLKSTDTLGTTGMNFYSFIDTSATTGTGSVVLATAPTITELNLAAGTASVGTAPLKITAGIVLGTPEQGVIEVDTAATMAYFTGNTTNGRGFVPNIQTFRLAVNAATGITTIANFFGTNSNIPLVSGGFYEIDIYAIGLKSTTAGAVTWSFINTAAPTRMIIDYEQSPLTGIAVVPTATPAVANIYPKGVYTSILATQTIVTGSLSASATHWFKFKILLNNATGTSLKIQMTAATGNAVVTPQAGSVWFAKRLPSNNVGVFAA